MLAGATGVLVTVTTLLMIYLVGAWDPTVLGNGGAEYRRLVRGFAVAAAALALAGLATRISDVRAWVFGAVPAACALAIIGRVALRRRLHRRRLAGECRHEVLAVGSPDAVADLITRTRRDRRHGWSVTAACTSTGAGLHPGRAGRRRPRRRRGRGPARPAPHRVGRPRPGLDVGPAAPAGLGHRGDRRRDGGRPGPRRGGGPAAAHGARWTGCRCSP